MFIDLFDISFITLYLSVDYFCLIMYTTFTCASAGAWALGALQKGGPVTVGVYLTISFRTHPQVLQSNITFPESLSFY